MENFVQLAIDAYKGRGTQANYSADDTQKVLRRAHRYERRQR